MLISYNESTSDSDNFDGAAGSGLVCTGQGKRDGGSRYILRTFGVFADAALSTVALRLYDDAETPNLMATLVSESSVTSYIESGMDVVIPPGWTLEVHSTGASSGGTAWAELELTGDV